MTESSFVFTRRDKPGAPQSLVCVFSHDTGVSGADYLRHELESMIRHLIRHNRDVTQYQTALAAWPHVNGVPEL